MRTKELATPTSRPGVAFSSAIPSLVYEALAPVQSPRAAFVGRGLAHLKLCSMLLLPAGDGAGIIAQVVERLLPRGAYGLLDEPVSKACVIAGGFPTYAAVIAFVRTEAAFVLSSGMRSLCRWFRSVGSVTTVSRVETSVAVAAEPLHARRNAIVLARTAHRCRRCCRLLRSTGRRRRRPKPPQPPQPPRDAKRTTSACPLLTP